MIPKIPFGRTGHSSARTLLGAAAFGGTPQSEVDATLAMSFVHGVNHVDTAAGYGESELRLGDWIKRHGVSFFLATKTGERTAAKATEQLHRSLDRLRVDHVDLLQLHNLVDPREWEIALGPGGALEAVIAARAQGLVRFIGVTGHGLTVARMHQQSLARYEFDSVLLPLNYLLSRNAEYLAEVNDLLRLCRSRQVAVQLIKTICRGPWGDRPRKYCTWYEPLDDQPEVDLAVHWALGHPGLFLNTVGDIRVLPKVLDAAARFTAPPTERQMQDQVTRLEMQPLFA